MLCCMYNNLERVSSCDNNEDIIHNKISNVSGEVVWLVLDTVDSIEKPSSRDLALRFYNDLKSKVSSQWIANFLKIWWKAIWIAWLSASLVACWWGWSWSSDSVKNPEVVSSGSYEATSSKDSEINSIQIECQVISPELQNIPWLVPWSSYFVSDSWDISYFDYWDIPYTSCDRYWNPTSGSITYSVQKYENWFPLYTQEWTPVTETYSKNLIKEIEVLDDWFIISNPFYRSVKLDFWYESFPVFWSDEIEVIDNNWNPVNLGSNQEIDMMNAELPKWYSLKILSPRADGFDLSNIKVIHQETATSYYLKESSDSNSYSYNY